MDKEEINKLKKIKRILAEYLGLEEADINDTDSLREDLHMSTVDLVDFTQFMQKQGFQTEDIDLSDTEIVTDLVEQLL